jgi:hypothetical protein
MRNKIFLAPLAVACLMPLHAQTTNRRADIVGGGNANEGRCTVEVTVDGAAEIQLRGDTAVMRNLNGQPPQWRRFQCSSPIPANPANFRFSGVDGRGRQELVQDPRNGGAAVVRIEDRDNGSEGYTFDISWNSGGPGGGFERGFAPQGRDDRDRDRDRDRDGDRDNRFTTEQAVTACQDAVRQEASQRFGPARINFRNTRIDDNAGRNDWVVGTVAVDRGRFRRDEAYRFSCSVDFRSGRLRTAHIGVPNY